jgi:hydrogenase nickel incorporation protein HypB
MSDMPNAIPVGTHRTIAVHKSLLEKNAIVAERNRRDFAARRLFVCNVVSAPGAGKTLLLERMLEDLGRRWRIGVVVADLATDNDAARLGRYSSPVLQLTTGTLCHLEAAMVAQATEHFASDLDALVIENVGNLVCPANFDLGESLRIVVSSVTEGEDKPAKYPLMYRTAHAIVINKVDLGDAAGFNWDVARNTLKRIAPTAAIFETSARTGLGLAAWHEYLDRKIEQVRTS